MIRKLGVMMQKEKDCGIWLMLLSEEFSESSIRITGILRDLID